ncbi:transcriptional protein SWT1 isoform X2 [Thrips palmi]|uniref:Transcriptional protein SWT1 isoform X2 n=1 Tax=Thrips palmi TaxID=161013 RepID=A0A6P9AIF4_THRPL|nr:transcriptional protein SWT1 isoform X2 [Thrips palmi]
MSESGEKRSLTTEKEWILKSSRSKPGKFYYFNVKTGESTWTRPGGYVLEEPADSKTTITRVPSKRKSDVNENHEQKKVKAHEPVNDCGIASTSTSSSGMENLSDNRKTVKRAETSHAAQTRRRRRSRPYDKARPPVGVPIEHNERAAVSSTSTSTSSSSQTSTVRNANKTSLVTVNTRNPFTECHTNSEGAVAIANVGEHLTSETVSSSHHGSVSKKSHVTRFKDTFKEKAQERLKKLQASLRKKQSKAVVKQLCSSNDSQKVVEKHLSSSNDSKKTVVSAKKDSKRKPSGQEHGPADRQLGDLEMNLKAGSLESPVGLDSQVIVHPLLVTVHPFAMASNNINHDMEAMEVEYMESEVLVDIEELRQKDVNVDLNNKPIFMDVDMEPVNGKSDPKSFTYIVLDTNILLSHLNFTAELLVSNLSGKGSAHLFIPWQVLHELDHLKDRGKSSIQPLARRAINFLHEKFSSKHSRIRGQKISEATKNTSNCADDNILQSCLQLKEQCFDVILVSNDINLRNKAIVSDVTAVSKDQLAGQIYEDKKDPLITDMPSNKNLILNKLAQDAQGERNKIYENLLIELKAIIKEILSEIVSKAMKEQYNHLWEKRTVIPPPWEHDQVLHCLSHHWLAICDDFIPPLIREAIRKLREFLKSMSKNLEEGLELTKAVFRGVSKKYRDKIDIAFLRLKELESKLCGDSSLAKDDNSSLIKYGNSPLTSLVAENDERIHLVLMCFEEAHNAALNICKSEYLTDSNEVRRAQCMMEAVGKLVHLLNVLLAIPISSLKEDSPAVNELVSLIKGDSSITPWDLILFLKSNSHRVLIENGIGQFTSFKIQLEHMLQRAI